MPTPTDSVIYNLDKTRLTVWFLSIVTWISCCSQDNIDEIFKLQKRCARIILDAQDTIVA